MGKRGGHKKQQIKAQIKKPQVWKDHKQVHQNNYFRKYYQIQFLPYFQDNQKEFDIFWQTMKSKLPVVFRVNRNQANYLSFIKRLLNQQYLTHIFKVQNKQSLIEPQLIPKLQKIQWYPGDNVFSLNTDKQILKKSKKLASLHLQLQKATDSGLVTRQQLVSMLPPLYLDIKSTDMILDMCAAPGSKTSEMLEMLYGQNRQLVKGSVIANDVQFSRAKMLIHQVQRSGTGSIAVISHNGQFIPHIYKRSNQHKQKVYFDKILCDVPCSGDGATRKLPNKWSSWHSNDGMNFHPLQLSLLIKGINLLKANGLLVYSTCSLNPIQDQAVVLAVMKRVRRGLKIIDIHKQYGVKGRRGLLNWKVCVSKGVQLKASDIVEKIDELFQVYKNYEQVKQNKKIKQSMFAQNIDNMTKYGIDNCMRILPHDENCGGFFLCLFKKQEDFEWFEQIKKQKLLNEQMQQKQIMTEINEQQEKMKEIQKKEQKQEQIMEKQIVKKLMKQQVIIKTKNKSDQYYNIDSQQYKTIQQFYGINYQNLQKLLFVRKSQDFRKKINIVSQTISQIINQTLPKLKIINIGCKVFQKGKQSYAGNQCLYRLCQDGIHSILPYITKRKIKISLQLFCYLIQKIDISHNQIKDQQIKKQISNLTQGSFTVYIQQKINNRKVIDSLVSQNYKNSMKILVSNQEIQSLKLRYF